MVQVEVKETSEIKKGDYAISKENRIIHVTQVDTCSDSLHGYFVCGEGYDFGYHCKSWCLSSFRKFYGTITIKCD